MILEAKPPGFPVERAYQEACLYAQKCNQPYSSGVNPTRFVVGCNGQKALFGYWDSEPEVTLDLDEIRVGNAKLDEVIAKFGFDQMAAHAQHCLNKVKAKAAVTPASAWQAVHLSGPAKRRSTRLQPTVSGIDAVFYIDHKR